MMIKFQHKKVIQEISRARTQEDLHNALAARNKIRNARKSYRTSNDLHNALQNVIKYVTRKNRTGRPYI